MGERQKMAIKNPVELLKELIRFKSITPSDGGGLEFIKQFLKGMGDFVEIEKNGVKNLVVIREGKGKKSLALAGHIDVVPPGNGWNSDPFSPTLREGYIYGRGAQDMKSGLAGLIWAFKNSNWQGKRIFLIITSDEEGEAKYGTLEVLKWMEREKILPDYGIVGEPTSEKVVGDSIKIGRRGSINGVLTIYGKQGHVAYPDQLLNPVELIAPLCSHFVGQLLDNGDAYFPPSKLVVTDIRGGMEVVNVTPDRLQIMFNIRNNTNTDIKKVQQFWKKILEGIGNLENLGNMKKNFSIKNRKKGKYRLKLSQSAYPFLTNPTSPIVIKTVEGIKKVCGITPKLSTAGGTSDARFFAQFGIEVVEFGVLNNRIHQTDERVKPEEVEQVAQVYLYLLNQIT